MLIKSLLDIAVVIKRIEDTISKTLSNIRIINIIYVHNSIIVIVICTYIKKKQNIYNKCAE